MSEWRQEIREGSHETFFINGVVELYQSDAIDPAVIIDLDCVSREGATALANKIVAADDMLQLLKDINDAAWSINSSLGNRIRELIHRAEGTNA